MPVSANQAVKHAANFDESLSVILIQLGNSKTLEEFKAGQIFLNACLNASYRELVQQEQSRCLKVS